MPAIFLPFSSVLSQSLAAPESFRCSAAGRAKQPGLILSANPPHRAREGQGERAWPGALARDEAHHEARDWDDRCPGCRGGEGLYLLGFLFKAHKSFAFY